MALEQWLTDPGATETQIRDPALLKLAFADLGPDRTLPALAAQQAAIHHHWVSDYEHRAAALATDDPATPDDNTLP